MRRRESKAFVNFHPQDMLTFMASNFDTRRSPKSLLFKVPLHSPSSICASWSIPLYSRLQSLAIFSYLLVILEVLFCESPSLVQDRWTWPHNFPDSRACLAIECLHAESPLVLNTSQIAWSPSQRLLLLRFCRPSPFPRRITATTNLDQSVYRN